MRQSFGGQRTEQIRAESGLQELRRRDVHGYPQLPARADLAEYAPLTQGLGQYPFAKRKDQPGLLGQSNEVIGGHGAMTRMLPAQQRLETHQAFRPGDNPEQWLIEQFELIAGSQSLAHLIIQYDLL